MDVNCGDSVNDDVNDSIKTFTDGFDSHTFKSSNKEEIIGFLNCVARDVLVV